MAGVEFGGEYRVRGEYKTNTGFADGLDLANITALAPTPPPGVTYGDENSTEIAEIGQRVRLWGVAKPTDDVTVKVTIQDTRTWGGAQTLNGTVTAGPGLTDTGANHLDLHESYVLVNDFFGLPVDLKVGRQELVYGDQRLIGSFGWSNNGRSFDAIKLSHNTDSYDVDFFYSKIREATAAAPVKTDTDQDFYGVYATIKSLPAGNTLDAYLLYLRDGRGNINETAFAGLNSGVPIVANGTALTDIEGTQELWTLGARLKGNYNSFDYTVEIPYQWGTIDTGTKYPAATVPPTAPVAGQDFDIQAWAFAAKAGYTFNPSGKKTRIGVEYDWASGDDNSLDGDIETFSNLFPTNHGHYGMMDTTGWRNIEAWNLNVSTQATDQLSVRASYWVFSLAEEEDGWYTAGNWMGTASTPGNSMNDEDSIGSEIDLEATYKYNKAVTIKAGYAHFFTDDLIDSRKLDEEDRDYGYLQLTANF